MSYVFVLLIFMVSVHQDKLGCRIKAAVGAPGSQHLSGVENLKYYEL